MDRTRRREYVIELDPDQWVAASRRVEALAQQQAQRDGVDLNRTSPHEKARIYQLVAVHLEVERTLAAQSQVAPASKVLAMPGVRYWSRRVAEGARDTAEFWRMRAFLQRRPPFHRWGEALDWLRSQREDARQAYLREREVATARALEWERARPEIPGGFALEVSLEARFVEYPDIEELQDDDHSVMRPAYIYAYSDELQAVWMGMKDLANITGWSDAEATMYLLAGVIPIRRFRFVSGPSIPSHAVTVTVYPPALATRGVGQFVAALRERMSMLTQEEFGNLSDQDRSLLDILQEVGPPPRGQGRGRRTGLAQYWRVVADQWNARFPETPVLPDALRKRWERLIAKAPALDAELRRWSE